MKFIVSLSLLATFLVLTVLQSALGAYSFLSAPDDSQVYYSTSQEVSKDQALRKIQQNSPPSLAPFLINTFPNSEGSSPQASITPEQLASLPQPVQNEIIPFLTSVGQPKSSLPPSIADLLPPSVQSPPPLTIANPVNIPEIVNEPTGNPSIVPNAPIDAPFLQSVESSLPSIANQNNGLNLPSSNAPKPETVPPPSAGQRLEFSLLWGLVLVGSVTYFLV